MRDELKHLSLHDPVVYKCLQLVVKGELEYLDALEMMVLHFANENKELKKLKTK